MSSIHLDELRHIALSLPGTTEDVKWGADLCFLVAGKMFVVTGLEEVPTGASFPVPPEEFDAWTARAGFRPAPYLARYQWVAVDDISRLSKAEWQEAIGKAYDRIKQKLPKKIRESL